MNNIKLLITLPVKSLIDNDTLDCAIWSSDSNICEFNEKNGCDESLIFYGTSNELEPKFCGYHFYTQVVNGDGVTNYKLISDKQAKQYDTK